MIAVNFQLFKLEIYCDDHSSLSSTTEVQYEFHIYFTVITQFVSKATWNNRERKQKREVKSVSDVFASVPH